MDRVNEDMVEKERRERIAAALQNGIVVVDGAGAVVWMDRTARQRVNGELQTMELPVDKAEHEAINCFIAPVELSVGGARMTVGVIQLEQGQQDADMVGIMEAVLAESTSWFTRTVIERLKAVRRPGADTKTANGSVQLDGLSAREREVLGLICEGHSDVQMAELLGLSENTVRNHIAALYRKIGVNRRTAAVIWARERGITCRDDLRLPRGRTRGSGNGRGNGGTPLY